MRAKQAWRIVKFPHSWVARLYKARYFPDCDFWTAPILLLPSFSWRSILYSCELLSQGSFSQIGDGFDTNIWSDHWIPGGVDALPLPSGNSPQIQRVSELIFSTGLWNNVLVSSLFEPAITQKILSIPLSQVPSSDRMI